MNREHQKIEQANKKLRKYYDVRNNKDENTKTVFIVFYARKGCWINLSWREIESCFRRSKIKNWKGKRIKNL